MLGYMPTLGIWCSLIFAASTQNRGTVILITQPGAVAASRPFAEQVVPQIEQMAQQLQLGLRVLDARDGVPAEVTLTPLIMFQNHLGRSVYLGRHNDIERIRNFLRTAQRVPQGAGPIIKTAVPTLRLGRAQLIAPLKITALTGEHPANFDAAQFNNSANDAVNKGLKRFKMAARVDLTRSDRAFYMDFYPWRGADGKFSVAVALFSQFNCKVPIFELGGPALQGAWSERAAVFAKAAAALESAVLKYEGAGLGGDGYQPVAAAVVTKSWDELQLVLPPAPASSSGQALALTLPQRWRVRAADWLDPPALQFRFGAPLDGYAGEVMDVSGELNFPSGGVFAGMRGAITADVKSLTMGEPLLDNTLHGEKMLHVAKHPTARFTILKVRGGPGPLAWGQAGQITMEGRLELSGTPVPLTVDATLEPIVDESGAPALQFRGRFQLDIRPFKLEGPDGPAPATHTLHFDFDLTLIAA